MLLDMFWDILLFDFSGSLLGLFVEVVEKVVGKVLEKNTHLKTNNKTIRLVASRKRNPLLLVIRRHHPQIFALVDLILVKLYLGVWSLIFRVAELRPANLAEYFLYFPSTFLYLPRPVTQSLEPNFQPPRSSRFVTSITFFAYTWVDE